MTESGGEVVAGRPAAACNEGLGGLGVFIVVGEIDLPWGKWLGFGGEERVALGSHGLCFVGGFSLVKMDEVGRTERR